jgi:hypothetical protein
VSSTGARVLGLWKELEREREKEWCPRVSSRRRTNFYKLWRAVAFIWYVDTAAAD